MHEYSLKEKKDFNVPKDLEDICRDLVSKMQDYERKGNNVKFKTESALNEKEMKFLEMIYEIEYIHEL